MGVTQPVMLKTQMPNARVGGQRPQVGKFWIGSTGLISSFDHAPINWSQVSYGASFKGK